MSKLTAKKPAVRSGIKHSLEAPLEGTKDFAQDLGRSVVNDFGIGGANEFLNELLGIDTASIMKPVDKHNKVEAPKAQPGGGPVEIFNAKDHKGEAKGAPKPAEKQRAPEKPKSRAEAAISYHGDMARSSERALQKKNRTLEEQIADIKTEIAKAGSGASKVHAKSDVSVSQSREKIGVGTFNFWDFIRRQAEEARKNADDSATWLNVAKGKNKKGYDPRNQSQHQAGEKTTIQNAAG